MDLQAAAEEQVFHQPIEEVTPAGMSLSADKSHENPSFLSGFSMFQ